MQIYQLQMHQLVCHSHVNNTFTNTLTLITNQPFITAPAWWGGRMKADRNEAPWCWDDDDSDYDMTDWVNKMQHDNSHHPNTNSPLHPTRI